MLAEQEIKTYQELQPYVSKIKTLEEIQNIIGERPHRKKIVMCHGVYDPVHPGHRRLFDYARRFVDDLEESVLIVGVTTDESATQGFQQQLYLPQGLRSINVASQESVNWVYISPNLSPINDIANLKPDFFIRSYEASKTSQLEEEEKVLTSYGGELVIASGDVDYITAPHSREHLILSQEQLLILKSVMQAEGVSIGDLQAAIKKFPQIRVGVIGDLIVDKYNHCTVLGPTPKATAFSVRVDGFETFVGGAGIVAKHLKSLGCEVTLTTVIGQDIEASFALEDLERSGVKVNALTEHNRPTTTKERFMTYNSMLLQANRLDNRLISEKTLGQICQITSDSKDHALICSDFRHGIFNKDTAKLIAEHIPAGILKIADSQVSNRWGNILDFRDFDLITPNEREARHALGDQDTPVGHLVQRLYAEAQCRYLILKLGREGMITGRRATRGLRAGLPLSSFTADAADPIGAGDALLAAATATLTVSQNIIQASILGNLCAALECSKLGNVPITSEELLKITDTLENNLKLA